MNLWQKMRTMNNETLNGMCLTRAIHTTCAVAENHVWNWRLWSQSWKELLYGWGPLEREETNGFSRRTYNHFKARCKPEDFSQDQSHMLYIFPLLVTSWLLRQRWHFQSRLFHNYFRPSGTKSLPGLYSKCLGCSRTRRSSGRNNTLGSALYSWRSVLTTLEPHREN